MLYSRPAGRFDARLGIVVAKRFAPRAVTRNTIKRVARELFRQTELAALDYIVRLSKPINTKADPATSVQLKILLRTELTRLLASQKLPENS